MKGLELSYQGEFAEAAGIFGKMIENNPSNPVGYFLKAAALESYMSDFSTFEPEEEFYMLLDQAIVAGKTVLEEEDDPEAQFVVGASHFFKGFHSGRKKRYLKALTELARAKPWLEGTVNIDSTFYDAYLGLGILEYLATRAKDYLIPFTTGKYESSIEMITLATRGKYTCVIAQEALVVALAGASKWNEAIERANSLMESYPQNRLFYWTLIEVYRRKEDSEGVISIGYDLLELVENGQPGHHYNQSLIRSYLAEAHLRLGGYRECIKQCDSVLSLLKGRDLDQRDKEVKEEAFKLRRRAARALVEKVDR